MITEIEKIFKKMLEEIVIDYKLLSVKGNPKEITVFRGIMPYEKEGELIPAISLRANKGINTLEKRELNIQVILETFNQDSEIGYDEHLEIIQKIIDNITQKGVIENIAEILPTVEWEFSEEETYPYFATKIIFKIISRKSYRTDVDTWINGE